MLTEEKASQRKVGLLFRLIPEDLLGNHKTRLKSMVLLLTQIINITVCLILIPVLKASFEDSPIVSEGGVNLIILCLGTYLLSLIILNRLGRLSLAGNITLIGIYLTAISTSWATNGIASPMMYLVLIPPVLAFVLTNMRSGYIWSIVALLTFSAFWGIDWLADQEWLTDEQYEQVLEFQPLSVIINIRDIYMLQIFGPIITLVTILFVVGIYERNSMQMNKMLSQERNLFAFKASHDPLTGLANRAEFDLRIKMAIDAASRSEYSIALIYIDLDGFKPINDEIGHHAGDVVLKAIARRLEKLVRETDTVARLGGDEFAVILQGIHDDNQIKPILEKILRTISEEITLEDGTVVKVHGSLGIAYYPEDAEYSDSLCRHADMAMYLAKEEKNTWRFFSQVKKT